LTSDVQLAFTVQSHFFLAAKLKLWHLIPISQALQPRDGFASTQRGRAYDWYTDLLRTWRQRWSPSMWPSLPQKPLSLEQVIVVTTLDLFA
jgi:hypothetical protein